MKTEKQKRKHQKNPCHMFLSFLMALNTSNPLSEPDSIRRCDQSGSF